ncbi:cofactor-independent phosphoglycerate mutase, partial [candidate division NPL-UPA2 bacterium]|nr:cofactor-independent phosphoglycerate mutase [candidate division NPL-UPA2 bacterium]
MKYIMLVGDGMADYPLPELGNKTPLEFARTPYMDHIAKQGRGGTAITVPKSMNPASDVAILSLLGYQPTKYYTGRGPLEAASLGINLKKDEVAFRCNLITVEGDTLVDYSAGHISNKEARILIKFLNEKLGNEDIKFYPGASYRHLMIVRGGKEQNSFNLQPSTFNSIKCAPPHDIIGQSFKKNFPRGKGGEILQKLMKDSFSWLDKHDINCVRRDLGENPGNMIWLWGQGTTPSMPTFKERFGVEGSVISAVDVVKGIARYADLEVINVPGATGYFDTDYEGMARAALKSLGREDFTFVHIEAPDEAGHMGDIRAKLKSIEDFDRKVVGIILEGLKNFPEYRVLVLPDHPTPLKLRTHTRDPI